MYRQLTYNTVWQGINVAANAILGVALTPYFINTLGTEQYGLWVFAASLSVSRGVLNLLDFGLQTAVIKFVAEAAARDRHHEIGAILSAALIGYAVLGVAMAMLIGGVGLWGINLVVALFHVPTGLSGVMQGFLLLTAAQTLIDFPALAVSGVLSGLQRYDVTRIWNLIRLLVFAGASIGLILLGTGVYALMLATSLSEVVRLIGHLYWLRRLLPEIRLTRQIAPDMARSLMGFSAQLFGYQLLRLVYQGMDKAIIALVLTTTLLTDYDVSAQIFALAYACLTLIGMLAAPVATTFYTRGQQAELTQLLLRVTRYTAACAVPVALIGMVLAVPVTAAWVGMQFVHTAPATAWFLSYVLFWALVQSGQNLLIGVGRVDVILPIFGVGTLVNLIVSVVAAPTLGVLGVIVGTVIGNALACVLYLIVFRQVFDLRLGRLWSGVFLRVYPQASIGALVAAGLAAWRTPRSLLSVGLEGGIGFLVFALLFVLTGLPADEQALVRNEIRRIRAVLLKSS